MSKDASSKTGTTQLSGNGYSKEMAKIYSNTLAHQSKDMEGFTSPGTNKHQQGIEIENMLKEVSHTNVMIAPTGSINLIEEESGESLRHQCSGRKINS